MNRSSKSSKNGLMMNLKSTGLNLNKENKIMSRHQQTFTIISIQTHHSIGLTADHFQQTNWQEAYFKQLSGCR